MNKLNLMKPLLWLVIAMSLLQPAFSSIQIQDHFPHILSPTYALVVVQSKEISEIKATSQQVAHDHHDVVSAFDEAKAIFTDCCQGADMSFCLMGCHFIHSESISIIIDFKAISPVVVSILWTSYLISAENPPPRIIV